MSIKLDRIVAKPGSKQYGRLSILTNWLTKSTKLFHSKIIQIDNIVWLLRFRKRI